MAIIQEVKDGKFVEDLVEEQKGKQKKTINNEMGQEMFLKLLVAEMQYQDPLEPTSNTEWVAQMASFSMVESLNDMKDTMAEQAANNLVGKYVLIADGDGFAKGKVDYVTRQDGKTKLSVDDKLYDLDKLDTVADQEYFHGSVLAKELEEMIQLLPAEENLTVFDEGLVKSAREAYENMTESQRKFVDKELMDKLRALEEKMDALKATEYTRMVRDLPSVEQVQTADDAQLSSYGSQLAKVSDYWDAMTEAQRKKVAEETVESFNRVQSAVEAKASTIQKPGGDPSDDDSSSTVSALLKKILEELQSQKTGNSAGDEEADNSGADDSDTIEGGSTQ